MEMHPTLSAAEARTVHDGIELTVVQANVFSNTVRAADEM
jgi:hypothetical protein